MKVSHGGLWRGKLGETGGVLGCLAEGRTICLLYIFMPATVA